jgi:uncharacterized RDD family membrane protein YckC
VSPAGVPLADFGTRVLAYLIDSAVLTIPTMVIALPAFFVVMFRAMSDPALVNGDPTWALDLVGPMLLLELGLVLFVLVIYYFYAVEYMHRTGQTLGKKLMKIRVVPIDPARRLTRGMAARRYLVFCVVGTIVPFFGLLDCLWLLWDKPYLQTLHDKAAETIVVKVSP